MTKEKAKSEFYRKATFRRSEFPKDILDYLTHNQAEIENLRERMRT